MSIRVMSRVWDNSRQEGGRLLVLLALADWANEDGECWPKLPQLATKARMSVRTAQRALLDLEEEGEIERTGAGGRGQPSTYRVLSGKGDNLSPISEPERVTSQTEKGDKSGAKRVTPVTRKGDNCVVPNENRHEPSLTATVKEPSEEEGPRTPVRTRPAPKPAPHRQAPSSSSDSPIDPEDEMQAAILEGCGLDPELTRSNALVSVADYAKRLKARRFTPDEIREAAAAWPECFPGRDLEDINPPGPAQLAEWVARRRASRAMATATTTARRPERALIAPFIER